MYQYKLKNSLVKVCGLDLSTSVVGYSKFEDGKLVSYDWYKFNKPDDYELIDLVEQFDEEVWPEIKDSDIVVLEDSLKKYQGGFSSRKTITVLLQFNAIIEYELRKRLGKENLTKLHPATAKKESFLGRGRVPSSYESPWSTFKDSKAWVIENAEKEFDSFEINYTHSDNPKPGSDDCADALVLANAYLNKVIE